jgi:ornithine cyclodeaminase
VFSRRAEARESFAAAVRQSLGLRATAAPTLEDAVADAPIVTLITNATEPFLTSAMVARGAHINAMGAIVPARSELAQDIFPRCGMIVVDSMRAVRELSSEFRQCFGDDPDCWNAVRPICDMIAQDSTRPADGDLTLFKAMGMGISDLALGIEILARAEKRGNVATLPERVRVAPRLQ